MQKVRPSFKLRSRTHDCVGCAGECLIDWGVEVARGEPNRTKLALTVASDKVREMV